MEGSEKIAGHGERGNRCRRSGEINIAGYITESNDYGAADRQGVRGVKE